MNKELIQKKISQLVGEFLVSKKYDLSNLKFEIGDFLIFKEWLDMTFNRDFEIESLNKLNNIEELTNFIDIEVNSKKQESDFVTENVSDDIGFLIFDLAINNTSKINWNELSKTIQSTFKILLGSINIEPEEVEFYGNAEKELFYTQYSDPDADFSALYIIFKDKVIFEFTD